MSSSWPNFCAVSAIVCGGLIADFLRALETEQFPLLIGGFDDAIGYERQPIAGSKLDGSLFVADFGNNSQRKPACGCQLFAIAIGRRMPGIRECEFAVLGDHSGAAGNKSTNLPVQNAVQICEHVSRVLQRAAAKSSDNRADGHGSLQTFAADVAHHDQQGSIVAGSDLEEIAAHAAGR